jgi:hypothetical protein
VFNVHRDTDWDLAGLQELAEAFATWRDSDAAPLQSDQLNLNQIIATDLTSLDGRRFVLNLDNLPGELVSPAMPNNVTIAFKADSGKRGRGVNGRTFVVGLTEDQCAGDTCVSATAVDWITALNNLIGVVAALTGSPELVVLHRIVDGVILTEQTWDAIQTYSGADIYLDSQRDRLPGHKKHKRTTPSVP